MILVRFYANDEDYRPIKWPIKHPYWCTGYGDGYSIIVAYADSVEDILELWPEATHINVMKEDVMEYTFSDRFPIPEWFEMTPSTEIELYWDSFYDLMVEVGMDDKLSEFDERLKKALKKEFGKDIKIEWIKNEYIQTK